MSAVEVVVILFGAITGYGLIGALLTAKKLSPPAGADGVPPHWTEVLGLPAHASAQDIELAVRRLDLELATRHAGDPRLPEMLAWLRTVREQALSSLR